MSTELLQQRYQRQIGWTVDKYTIEALLGIGGMAAVFRARHRNGNPVALKVLHAENSLDPDTRARFLREGYTANKVGHEGAVRVLDEGMTADGTVFLVMELLEGETLDERWERHGQTLSVKDVASISHQILDVLAAAHEKSIVHRDIKPDNIFITTTGAAKILDFGIARLGEAPKGPSMTQTGKSFGTPAYMPPEQALGRREEVDGKTDLWALGATMFAMISGEHVHPAETTEELVVFTATRPARSIAVPDVPAPIARVVDRALAFAKAERWSDARAMRQALGEAYAEAFGEQVPAEVADPPVATAPVPWPVDEGAKAQAPTIVTMTRSAGGASGASSGRRRLAIAVTAGVLLGAGVLALRVSGTPPDAHAGATASAGAPVGTAIAPALPAVTAPRNDALAAPATSASAAAPIASVATQATSAPRPRPAVHPARPPAPSGAPAPAHDIFKP